MQLFDTNGDKELSRGEFMAVFNEREEPTTV